MTKGRDTGMDELLADINYVENIKKESSPSEKDIDCIIRNVCELPNCLNCRRLK